MCVVEKSNVFLKYRSYCNQKTTYLIRSVSNYVYLHSGISPYGGTGNLRRSVFNSARQT